MIDLANGPTDMPPGFDWLREHCATSGGKFIETNHHVIAYIPGRYKTRLLVGFDNLSSANEIEKREPWGYPIAAKRGWGSLGVMIKRKDWFRSPDLWEALEQLRDDGLFAAYKEVSMYGSSMGGFGAAMFAPLAPGCTVLAMAPQTSLSQQITPFENRYRHARSFADWSHGPNRDATEGIKAAGKAYVLYDPYIPQDKAHAERLAGDNVELLPCRHMSHKLPPMFRRMGILKDVAYEGLDGSLTRDGFYGHLRKRREAVPYILELAKNTGAAGHPKLGLRAVDWALGEKPNWKLRQLRRELRDQIPASTPTPRFAAPAVADMNNLPVISSMWIGPPLSYLEQLCLKSFVDAGHRVKLYCYAPIGNIPDGVEVADAADVLPADNFVLNKATGKPGPQSDRFRYHLLRDTDEVWVDTDAYCVKPFPKMPAIVACHYEDVVANGVLRLPKDSKTLTSLLEFTDTEYPIIPDDFGFMGDAMWKQYRRRRGSDDPMHASEMPWSIWGPFAISYFMRKHNELDMLLAPETLYPISGRDIARTLWLPRRAQISLPDNCWSVHFYGSKFRELVMKRENGVPHPRSYIGQLLKKHGIDPEGAPLS